MYPGKIMLSEVTPRTDNLDDEVVKYGVRAAFGMTSPRPNKSASNGNYHTDGKRNTKLLDKRLKNVAGYYEGDNISMKKASLERIFNAIWDFR